MTQKALVEPSLIALLTPSEFEALDSVYRHVVPLLGSMVTVTFVETERCCQVVVSSMSGGTFYVPLPLLSARSE